MYMYNFKDEKILRTAKIEQQRTIRITEDSFLVSLRNDYVYAYD